MRPWIHGFLKERNLTGLKACEIVLKLAECKYSEFSRASESFDDNRHVLIPRLCPIQNNIFLDSTLDSTSLIPTFYILESSFL